MSEKPQFIPEDPPSQKKPRLTEEEWREIVRQVWIKNGRDPDEVKWKDKSSSPGDTNVCVIFLKNPPFTKRQKDEPNDMSTDENTTDDIK